jgi:hypothetical protein
MSREEFDMLASARSPMPPWTTLPPVRRRAAPARRGLWGIGAGVLTALALLLAGCNPWEAHYTRLQTPAPLGVDVERRLVMEKVDPESLSAVNVPEGWELIGYSEWEGTTPATIDLERALERFAREQGAARVLWGWRYARRAARTETVPVTRETRTRTVISGGRSEVRDTSTTTTEWVAQTTEEDRFQYRALFLVPRRGP